MRTFSPVILTILLIFSCAQQRESDTFDLSISESFELKPFPLSRIALLEGPFHNAMERTTNYLKFLDADRMLYNFRRNYGLPTLGVEPLGGWEKPDGKLRGHSTGHFLVALAQAYASTGEKVFKEKAEYVIAELAKCQQLAPERGYGEGYLSAYGEYQFEELEQLQTYPNIWAPYYTQHKILSGLLACFYHLDSDRALDIAVKMADWVYARLRKVESAQLQKMWNIYIAGEYGGMNEVLAELHAITGEPKYLAAAHFFDHDKIFAPCADNVDALAGNHANQTIPKITGALRVYDQSSDTRYFALASNFWRMVTGSRMYIIGGTSEAEMFKETNRIGAFLTNKTCETCCTYNMLKLSKQLFLHQPDAAYMDYYERALYNHILASQDTRSEHGFTTYFVPLNAGGRKRYSNDYRSFTCCHGTGMENHTKYGESIYFHADSALWVNLFIPSELDWTEKRVKIRQDTRFPLEQGTTLSIMDGSARFALNIRRPIWAKKEFVIKINGIVQSATVDPGNYISLSRQWRKGDTLTITMPFEFQIEYTRDVPEIGGFLYGPLVLAGEGVTEMKTLDLDPSNPADAFSPYENVPLRFRLGDITLTPFYTIHGIPYSVYFTFNKNTAFEK